jgi:hypothetical protein
MPLLDHFHAPIPHRAIWDSFHVTWATAMAAALNRGVLPADYFAAEHAHAGGRVEIDVGTYREPEPVGRNGAGGTATLTARAYAPPAAAVVVPAAFPDVAEVRVYETVSGARLVAAVELVSPSNKDRPDERRAFVQKCAGLLAQTVAVVVVDVVTTLRANLHADLMAALGGPTGLPADAGLYAAAYRPIVRNGNQQIEVWPHRLAVGEPMPTVPLALNAGLCVPLDLEATYAEACGWKGIR